MTVAGTNVPRGTAEEIDERVPMDCYQASGYFSDLLDTGLRDTAPGTSASGSGNQTQIPSRYRVVPVGEHLPAQVGSRERYQLVSKTKIPSSRVRYVAGGI